MPTPIIDPEELRRRLAAALRLAGALAAPSESAELRASIAGLGAAPLGPSGAASPEARSLLLRIFELRDAARAVSLVEQGWAAHWMKDGFVASTAAVWLASGDMACRRLARSWPERGWALFDDPKFPLRSLPEQAALGEDPEFAAFVVERASFEEQESRDRLLFDFMAMATRPSAIPAMSLFAFSLIEADPAPWAALRRHGSAFSPMMQCFKNSRLDLAEAMLRADSESALASCSPEFHPAMCFPILHAPDPLAAIELLRRFGADPLAACPRTGETPLHMAASIDPPQGAAACGALIRWGADPWRSDSKGFRPIDDALLAWDWPLIQKILGARPADLLEGEGAGLLRALAQAHARTGADGIEAADARLALPCREVEGLADGASQRLAKSALAECARQGLAACFDIFSRILAGLGASLEAACLKDAFAGPCRIAGLEAASLECAARARWGPLRILPEAWGQLAALAEEAKGGRPGDEPHVLAALALRHVAASLAAGNEASLDDPALLHLPEPSRQATRRWASMAEKAQLGAAAAAIGPAIPAPPRL